jgi:hypothetical protein
MTRYSTSAATCGHNSSSTRVAVCRSGLDWDPECGLMGHHDNVPRFIPYLGIVIAAVRQVLSGREMRIEMPGRCRATVEQ